MTEPLWENVEAPRTAVEGAGPHACAGMVCRVCHIAAGIAADEAVSRGLASANTEWKNTALFIFKHLSHSRDEFTTDEVMLELERYGLSTHDARALGGVTRKALSNGWMTEVGMTKSRRRHGARIPVYMGNLGRRAS